MSDHRKYLIVKGSGGGGLGDRIRSVLTAIVYAKLSNRTIYVDWSDGKLVEHHRNVFYNIFRLKNIAHTSSRPACNDVLPSAWRGKLDMSLHDLYEASGFSDWDRQAAIQRFSFDQSNLDYPNKILVMWEFDQFDRFSAFYSPKSGRCIMRDIVSEHLGFTEQITNEVQRFKQKAYSAGEAIIAVHIRATDEFKQQKNTVYLDKYVSRIKSCLRASKHKAKIFLATDNSEIERLMHLRFPGQLITREKWFAAPGDRIHLNRECPDADKSLRDAMIEICLLADSDYLIYQYNSSFGMFADFMFKSNAENIFKLVPAAGSLAWLKGRLKKDWRKNW